MRFVLIIALASRIFAQAPSPTICPIEIKKVYPHWPLGQGDPWGSYLMIVFANSSAKTITAARFDVAFVDSMGDTHESVYSYDSDTKVKPGKSSHPSWEDGVYAGDVGHKIGAVVWAKKIRFTDDTFFVDDGTHSCGTRNTTNQIQEANPRPVPTPTPASTGSDKLKGICHQFYTLTSEKKASELTASEVSAVNSCQKDGFYN